MRNEPCIALDMTASTLTAAGIGIPEHFHGRPLFGSKAKPRGFIVTAGDRCDETIDRIRAVRDGRYKYIRNFMPERPYTQPSAYIEGAYPTQRVLKELHAAGKLNSIQELWMAERKPPVESSTTRSPIRSRCATSPQHQKSIAKFSARLDAWMTEIQDKGGIPESKEELDQWIKPPTASRGEDFLR